MRRVVQCGAKYRPARRDFDRDADEGSGRVLTPTTASLIMSVVCTRQSMLGKFEGSNAIANADVDSPRYAGWTGAAAVLLFFAAVEAFFGGMVTI